MVEGNNNNSHNFVDLWQSLRWDVPRWQNDDDLTAGAMFDENRSYPSSDHENLLISDVFHGLFGVAIQVYSKQKNCPLDMIHPVIQSARRFFLLRVTLLSFAERSHRRIKLMKPFIFDEPRMIWRSTFAWPVTKKTCIASRQGLKRRQHTNLQHVWM